MISDWIFASIALAGLLVFVGIINVYVMEPDLWVVSLAIMSVAVWFTLGELKAGGSKVAEEEADDN